MGFISEVYRMFKNSIIANKSVVSDDDIEDDKIQRLSKKLPKEMRTDHSMLTYVKKPTFTKIQNGKDEYFVVDSIYYQERILQQPDHQRHSFNETRCFFVLHDNNIAPMKMYRRIISTHGLDEKLELQGFENMRSELEQCNVYLDVRRYTGLPQQEPRGYFRDEEYDMEKVDLHDINDIRMAFSHYYIDSSWANEVCQAVGYYIDKFIIVSPEDREKYARFVEEKQNVHWEEVARDNENKDTKEKEEAAKQKAHAEKRKQDAKLVQKRKQDIKNKFFGNAQDER